ncbi:hypothetical protein FNV43_RR23087 [Rhamnella rubrinervis]|uniref:PPPDE domain-containing protein n=1 Tax=Rhamnella rubrinervis TaxID=2594499 RepID=A0A8K0DRM9_9ROSA|nr:hypothetical protein FNV43_RR23087 [Rhamnella rubrinervis]
MILACKVFVISSIGHFTTLTLSKWAFRHWTAKMAEEGHRVTLNVYDLSQGLARQLSTTFLGKAIEGIWHTGVVVYGNEYYFGGGIQHSPAGSTPYGTPIRVVDLGVTHVPKDVFEMYLQEISPRYTAETYSLLSHNCNNFSNEVSQFLVGATIPDYILQLPTEVMSSPMGALILPMIQNLETTLKAGAVPQVPQFRPVSVAQQPIVNVKSGTGQLNAKEADVKLISEGQPSKSKEQNTSEKSVEAKPRSVANGAVDPLGNARSKVQEEITTEFAAIMATGTLRASEAAALATRRVMERYGNRNSAVSQS